MQRSASTDFLHGPMTAQSAVAAVKEALIKGLEKHFEILYYRKNGEWRDQLENGERGLNSADTDTVVMNPLPLLPPCSGCMCTFG